MGQVARVTEITARSEKSFEDAIQIGIQRASETLRHVSGAWIKEQKIEVHEGQIRQYQVDMLVTFVLDSNSASSNGATASAEAGTRT